MSNESQENYYSEQDAQDLYAEWAEMKGEDPCWKGYEMQGHKMKNGKKVPNCVKKQKK